MTETQRIFISYARRDGRDLALRLQADLNAREYDAWLDTREIDGGASWGAEIERAIDGCHALLALLSPGSYSSEICRGEQLRALRKGKRVLPLLVQASADRPVYFESLNYRDFSDPAGYAAAFAQLLIDLRGDGYIAPQLRQAPNTAPPLPAHFVQRPDALNALRTALLSDATDRHVALTALRGMGGIGKSALANALCHDEAIRDAFPDGVFWVEIGREPSELTEKLKAVGTALGDAAGNYASPDLAASSFRALLPRKAALIVLDDVWERRVVEPFLVDAPRARWLVTTRDGHISTALGATEVRLGTMTPDQALDLLRRWAGRDDAALPRIAEQLDQHPLALKLVGARLRDGLSGGEWLAGFDSVARIKLGRRPTRADESIQLCFDLSTEQLGDDRPLYHALGVFPEDVWIPEATVARLWRTLTPGLSAADCAEIIEDLDRLALVEREAAGSGGRALRMHDLLHSYNREALRAPDADPGYPALQSRFVAALGDPRALPDDYAWRFIGYHLIEAGRGAELRALLLDADFLRAKLAATEVNALIDDCALALTTGEREADSAAIRLLSSALLLSSHILAEDKAALAHQLVGRLATHRRAHADLRALTDALMTAPGVYPFFDDKPILQQAGGSLLRTLAGHTRRVNGALELRDGRILSWSWNGTLRLWSSAGDQLAVLKGHTHFLRGAMALADGRFLSWAEDATLRLWSSEGAPLAVLEGHTAGVDSALALDDGRFLSWSEDATLRLWSSEGDPLAVLEGHTGRVGGALALADGRLLSWSADSTLRLWSSDGAPLVVLEGHTGDVYSVLTLADGRFLSWSDDHTLRLWSSEGAPLAVLEGHTGGVNGALALADGRILSWTGANESEDHTLRLWSSVGAPLAVLEGHTGGVNGALALADGRLLSWAGSYGSKDHTLRLWSSEGAPLAVLEGHTWYVRGALALADGRFLSWSVDKMLRLWSSEGTPLAILEGHTGGVTGILVLDDGRFLSWSNDNTLRLWSSEGVPLAVLKGHTGSVTSALALADGRLLSWSEDATLRLWRTPEAGDEIAEKVTSASADKGRSHHTRVNGLLRLVAGRFLSWSEDATLRLWSSEGTPLAVLEGHRWSVLGALALVDGRFLSWSHDATLRLWSSEGAPLAALEGHTSRVNGALALADGRFLSWSGDYNSKDHTLRLWSSEGAPLAILAGHRLDVSGALVLTDGRFLSWSDDHTLRLWSSEGAPLAVLEGHTSHVSGALALADGRFLSWAGGVFSDDHTLRLWSSEGASLAILKGRTSDVTGALALVDGRFLSWSYDNTLRLWSSEGAPLAVLDEPDWNDRPRIFAWAREHGFDPEILFADTDPTMYDAYRVGRRSLHLDIYRRADGVTVATFHADAGITALVTDPARGLIVAGDEVGRVMFLRWPGEG